MNLRILFVFVALLTWAAPRHAAAEDSYGDSYADDDRHNHDGSHPPGAANCGGNYMLPGAVARLGSHSFLILGQVDDSHILAEHRSGTPPHNYQFIIRVRLDKPEMDLYQKLLHESSLPPAFTTIYFDDANSKTQLDRTFFCLNDLPRIFGKQKVKGDEFERLFPIRASLQKNADFEGAFEIQKSIYPGGHFSLDRDDVELVMYRYLPAYLEQSALRKTIKERPGEIVPLLTHAPLYAAEPSETASAHPSYSATDGAISKKGETCPADYYLKNYTPPKTIHTFMLLAQTGPNTVIASHLYDQAPQNFQTIVEFKLSDEEMNVYRRAKEGTSVPPLLQTRVTGRDGSESENYYFCLAELKKQISSRAFSFRGTVYRNSDLEDYKLGEAVGTVSITAPQVRIVTNRNLASLMNPVAVAKDVLGESEYQSALPAGIPPEFVDVSMISPAIQVEMRYFSNWNFLGRPVPGYSADRCLLTRNAANALALVQADVEKLGYSLLVFDCYRPARAVAAFLNWTRDLQDNKMQKIFFPDEPKDKLVERGYIAEKSSHSRGSTVDLTLVRSADLAAASNPDGLRFKEDESDCRSPSRPDVTHQIDMGTSFDCFSEAAHTDYPKLSESARSNRQLLKREMEKFGFQNYPKEWWHFTLKGEPFKEKYFDFAVR